MEARTEDGSISPTLVNLTNRPSVDVHQIPFNVTDPETTVFGPFWRIARVLGLVEGRTNGIDISSNGHKTLASRIIPTVLIIASAAPILARTIWLGSKMGQYKVGLVLNGNQRGLVPEMPNSVTSRLKVSLKVCSPKNRSHLKIPTSLSNLSTMLLE